ncbi:AraC family transcriptional regulator [Noviherbaspirillum sp. Root189]|uniref:AraC family transcriptional regulator n=1 Tax=Noviherbaspirillum sp. Root189 TaxID=1736487 RepID=UPI00070C7075|nr:AraC family transcriptional regulator [Noviherbaspirillum sp. Root189]KRB93543.1 hypothetical protein ASE07_12670 [Noviherbaspirillum sp. Root189]
MENEDVDLLSDVLLSIRVEATAFVNFHLRAPWGLEIKDADRFEPAYCYCIIEGRAIALQNGKDPVTLLPGDTLLLPHGGASTIASSPDAKLTLVGDIWQQQQLPNFDASAKTSKPIHVHLGAGGDTTRALALAYRFRGQRHLGLMAALPQTLVLRGGQHGATPFIRTALDFLTVEEASSTPGYMALANELAELLFISFLREYIIQERQHAPGWLRALFDPQIRKALQAIHQRPQHAWTVEGLAEQSGMSRSAFAQRFNECAGQSPIDYLTEWRVTMARDALANSDRSIGEILASVGYQSESAFRKAFLKKTGTTPSEFRKRGRTQRR